MERTSFANNNNGTVDDPCWGGPESSQHSLNFLLNQISIHQIIIHESTSYLVLHKPPDLRMDGPYPATVHKLVTYWYPPKSLEGKKDSIIPTLNTFSDLEDNTLKPCHQLDYATSGVLLLARNRLSAAAACSAFHNRRTKKEYLAIVHGHVDISSSLPILSKEYMTNAWDDIEKQYRRGKANQEKKTFAGFLPPHAVFEKWKGSIKKGIDEKKRKIEECCTVQKNETFQSNSQWIHSSLSSLTPQEIEEMLAMKWSQVKHNSKFKQMFKEMADTYNEKKRNAKLSSSKKDSSSSGTQLPQFFQVQDEDPNSFYINASIAELPNSFQMTVDPTSLQKHKHQTYYESFAEGHDVRSLDYKPSLTHVIVKWKGLYDNSHAVSKVLLRPYTGRRHQLRWHMVVCGHAIVGDVTYEHPSETLTGVKRMCLHAWSLSIPLVEGEEEEKEERTFVAPDPFPLNRVNSMLCIEHFSHAHP